MRNQLGNLSTAEKAGLLDAVWESLQTDAASLTDAERVELDRRIERHEKNPSDVIPYIHFSFPLSIERRRRAGVWRFPYGVFFEIQKDQILIVACFHGGGNPKRWEGR